MFIKKTIKEIMLKVKFPLLKTIVFESNPELCGNTYEIYKEMTKRALNTKYRFVWLVEDKNNYINNQNTYYINYGKNYYERLIKRLLLTFSAVIIFENRFFIKKWKNQTVINLTHGMPIKKCKSYVEHDTCDYVISSSNILNKYLAKELDFPISRIITLGYPRNDLLFDNKMCLEKLDLKKYSKTIIWLPTFRKHKNYSINESDGKAYKYGIPLLNNKKDFFLLNEKLKTSNICLIIKLHPAQDCISIHKHNEYSNIIFINDNLLKKMQIKLYNLLGEVDALITDYSSVYYDFLLTDKPIALILDDIDEYKNNCGFAIPEYYDFVKGEYIYKFDEIMLFIDCVYLSIDKSKKEREEIKKVIYDEIPMNSTKNVTDFIINAIRFNNC